MQSTIFLVNYITKKILNAINKKYCPFVNLREILSQKETFKRVIIIVVKWCISTAILTFIANYPSSYYPSFSLIVSYPSCQKYLQISANLLRLKNLQRIGSINWDLSGYVLNVLFFEKYYPRLDINETRLNIETVHTEILFRKSYLTKQNLNCSYTFPIDLALKRTTFVAKSNGKK